MRKILLICTLFLAGATASPAGASPSVQYGIQDDAWLQYGDGTLQERIAELDALGVDLVRYTLSWHLIEPRRGERDWSGSDAVLRGLRSAGIGSVVTIWGAPRWANLGRSPSWAPASGSTFASFAAAAAKRYPWVKKWLIWNEPNQRRWLRPTSASTYVSRLLNPAYAAIHRASRGAKVAGGVTAPRGSAGGVSPVDFIRGMRDPVHGRLRALRDDHDGDARAAAPRGVAQLRREAHLADRVRLPDKPAGSHARRLPRAPGSAAC
jgi:hypothetical protein